jgi:hypothetical protein
VGYAPVLEAQSRVEVPAIVAAALALRPQPSAIATS